MKYSIDQVRASKIFQFQKRVKKAVMLFKKGSLNDELPYGVTLKQKRPTRLEIIFDVVQRLLNAILLLDEVIEKHLVVYSSAVQAKEQLL